MKVFLRHILPLLVVALTTCNGMIAKTGIQGGKVTVGVMLPLHDGNTDGKRMVEYYRGVLMACDSLRQTGMSIDIHAWNVADETDISQTLNDNGAQQCDLIIGPLYANQLKPLADFAKQHDIKVLIPFSITAPELAKNDHLFQVYQSAEDYNDLVISNFLFRFKGHHVVFVDCNDSTSRKGLFTLGLRNKLEKQGIEYSITNLRSTDVNFAKAFSRVDPNVVILNTGRSNELSFAFAKLNSMLTAYPTLRVRMFGYTEWMMYAKNNLDNFYKFDVHIPSSYFYNVLSPRTARFQQKYRWNFHADMINAYPRLAITGFDHAFYFIRGLYLYGDKFVGTPGAVGYTSIQTPLSFKRVSPGGGFKNKSLLFVHYTTNHKVETLYY
ncbi:MAG: peptidoglycan-binding protein LysM [Prevotella sp.]